MLRILHLIHARDPTEQEISQIRAQILENENAASLRRTRPKGDSFFFSPVRSSFEWISSVTRKSTPRFHGVTAQCGELRTEISNTNQSIANVERRVVAAEAKAEEALRLVKENDQERLEEIQGLQKFALRLQNKQEVQENKSRLQSVIMLGITEPEPQKWLRDI